MSRKRHHRFTVERLLQNVWGQLEHGDYPVVKGMLQDALVQGDRHTVSVVKCCLEIIQKYIDHESLGSLKPLVGHSYCPAVAIFARDGSRHVPTFEFHALAKSPTEFTARAGGVVNETFFADKRK